MCIRDRRIIEWSATYEEALATMIYLNDRFAYDGRDPNGYTNMPVSYTHLRAHETVLDIVCRLLLEKKKHNILSTTRT